MSSINPTPTFAVFDIDGVLADVRHRLHFVAHPPKDWDSFFDAAVHDTVLEPGRQAVAQQVAAGRQIVYVTGRPEGCLLATRGWLEHHGFPQGQIYMRGRNDRRPARIVKPELLRRLARTGSLGIAFDDDEAVVKALHSAFSELEVIHVRWMTEPDLQDTLFAAQEDEGRT